MVFSCAKLSIFSCILHSRQCFHDVTELGTSWKNTAEQNDTLGVRISRLLTVELDMQAPPPHNTLLLSPGKGQDKKLASKQKPGKSGKPTTNVASEGSLPQSPQNKVKTEKKEKKTKGTDVKSRTDKQTPEQSISPGSPSGHSSAETTAPSEQSGSSDAQVASEALSAPSQKEEQCEKVKKKPRGLGSSLAHALRWNKGGGGSSLHWPFLVSVQVALFYGCIKGLTPWIIGSAVPLVVTIGLMLLYVLIRSYNRRDKGKSAELEEATEPSEQVKEKKRYCVNRYLNHKKLCKYMDEAYEMDNDDYTQHEKRNKKKKFKWPRKVCTMQKMVNKYAKEISKGHKSEFRYDKQDHIDDTGKMDELLFGGFHKLQEYETHKTSAFLYEMTCLDERLSDSEINSKLNEMEEVPEKWELLSLYWQSYRNEEQKYLLQKLVNPRNNQPIETVQKYSTTWKKCAKVVRNNFTKQHEHVNEVFYTLMAKDKLSREDFKRILNDFRASWKQVTLKTANECMAILKTPPVSEAKFSRYEGSGYIAEGERYIIIGFFI
ncbi:hypothetical protein AK88_01977 [Plasmodium fragile]|uniref:Plasmodium RESA N-terminal domain-containing protein n=1 Tax=Plasmodium fragile TaxID=5857 RepID=A0A0D9QRQ5_PLAFR|nr:uncharacterized protein AK88_01977 [Plasmodium fragile]KJP88361.1 hypothetical protein AK88_01977 [Plasmodium fragile]